jgi:hypothetical protein
VMGGTGPSPAGSERPSTAPAIGVPQADTIGAPLAPVQSRQGGGSGVMGGTGPPTTPQR